MTLSTADPGSNACRETKCGKGSVGACCDSAPAVICVCVYRVLMYNLVFLGYRLTGSLC